MCGAGLDANAVYGVNSGLKKQVGSLAYVWSGLKQMMRPLEAVTAKFGEERLTGALVVVSKSRLYGGSFVLTPNAHLLADRFEIVCFRSQSAFEYPGYFAAVFTKTMNRLKGVVHRQYAAAEVFGEDQAGVYVQVDGELIGALPIGVRLGPEAVRLLAPPDYWNRWQPRG